MRAYTAQEIMVRMNLKSKPIKHINACLPAVFVSFHLLDSKGRVIDVIHEEFDFAFKFFLGRSWKFFIILLKNFGSEDFHFLRSNKKSSADLNAFVFPAAISLSASASAFFQSNPLKYGGRVNAYLTSSATASPVLFLCSSFLYLFTSSRTLSDKVIVNSCVAIVLLLLIQNSIRIIPVSIYEKRLVKGVISHRGHRGLREKTKLCVLCDLCGKE